MAKTGIIAICAARQCCVPFKGWALIPDKGRGEGYDITAVTETYLKHHAALITEANNKMNAVNDSMLGSSLMRSETGIDSSMNM